VNVNKTMERQPEINVKDHRRKNVEIPEKI
jgi:hypothetical protein